MTVFVCVPNDGWDWERPSKVFLHETDAKEYKKSCWPVGDIEILEMEVENPYPSMNDPK